MVPPLELLRLPLSTELPYLNIPLFCFDSEFVPFVCLFFPTVLNTASTKGAALLADITKKVPISILSKNCKLLFYALKGGSLYFSMTGKICSRNC